MAETSSKSVLIIGGGFGGVRAARQLAKHHQVSVKLLTPETEFSYYPQLYHAATGGVRSEASIPLAELLEGLPVEIIQDSAQTFDPEKKTVTTVMGKVYTYDKLVIAVGSVTNYFGIPGLQEFSYDIKTITGAEAFKQHLHASIIEEKKPELHYVIVGAGPTGVELASALGEYLEYICKQHEVKRPKYTIDLVEAAPRILPRSSEHFAAKVHQQLQHLGVHIMTGATVEAETVDTLRLKGENITSKTVVWTAGVANNPFIKANAQHFNLAKNGRVEVDNYMEARPDVYVIGDNAVTPHGGLALSAVNDANFVAKDILRTIAGQSRPPYHQPTPMTVLPVGHGWAGFAWGKLEIFGYTGWILRRLGDLVAYHDMESTPKAVRVWLQDQRRDDDCKICTAQA